MGMRMTDLLARVDSALLRNLSTIDAAPPLFAPPSLPPAPLDLPPVRLSAPSKVDTDICGQSGLVGVS